jgi:hypothetical protein
VQTEPLDQKAALCEIVKMLFGLRRARGGGALREDPEVYQVRQPWLFAHERLEAYLCGLKDVDGNGAMRLDTRGKGGAVGAGIS